MPENNEDFSWCRLQPQSLILAVKFMDHEILLELAENPKSLQYSWDSNIRPVLGNYFRDFGFEDLIEYLENYSSPPFTIQRIAEILLNPAPLNINSKCKRALEKCLKVSTTINQIQNKDLELKDDMMQL